MTQPTVRRNSVYVPDKRVQLTEIFVCKLILLKRQIGTDNSDRSGLDDFRKILKPRFGRHSIKRVLPKVLTSLYWIIPTGSITDHIISKPYRQPNGLNVCAFSFENLGYECLVLSEFQFILSCIHYICHVELIYF